jgi:prepilin-type N-terminal cleavage/methylation domain-containing protein
MHITHKGFSLTELMVALAVIGIVGLISTPNLVTGLSGYRLKNAARDVCSSMRKARTLAVKQNRNVTIYFDTAHKTYVVDGQFPWPNGNDNINDYYGSGVVFGRPDSAGDAVTFNGGTVTFNEQGMSIDGSGVSKVGYVYVTDNRGKGYRIGVQSIAGCIVLQQWTGSEWK